MIHIVKILNKTNFIQKVSSYHSQILFFGFQNPYLNIFKFLNIVIFLKSLFFIRPLVLTVQELCSQNNLSDLTE